MKKNSIIVLLLLLANTLVANIRIVNTTPAAGGCTGTIKVEATGTAGPFTIKLVKPDGSEEPYNAVFSGNKTLTGLCDGNYLVKVYNRFACAAELSARVSKQLSLRDSITYTCDAPASIAILPTGGEAPFTYNWSGPVSTQPPPAQNPITANLSGTYKVTVTDSKGITATRTINYVPLLSQPRPTSSQISIQASCSSGQGGGAVCINVDTSKWKVEWPALNKIGTCVNNLNAGTYCYKLTDRACNKVIYQCAVVPIGTQTALAILSDTSRDCSVPQDKKICISGSGGLGPYQISWSNGSTNTCQIRSTGTRTVTITDVCNSTASKSFNFGVTFPSLRVVSVTEVNNCATSGYRFHLKVSGGKGPYTYEWSVGKRYNAGYDPVPGDINDPSSPLIPKNIGYPGPAKVVIKDACNNILERTYSSAGAGEGFTFTPIDPMGTCSYIVIGVGEYDQNTNANLTFKWNTGATDDRINITAPGTYTLTITNTTQSTGKCQEVYTTTIPTDFASPFFKVNYVVSPATNGVANGSIDLNIFGGNRPLRFTWAGSSVTTEDRINLAAGTYTVTVANNANPLCSKTLTIVVPSISTNLQEPGAEDLSTIAPGGNSLNAMLTPFFRSKVFPNPFDKIFNLEIESSLGGSCEIYLYNSLGQVVLNKNVALTLGTQQLNVDVGDLQNQQVYYVFIRHVSGKINYHKVIQVGK
jgi:hypothetical protein